MEVTGFKRGLFQKTGNKVFRTGNMMLKNVREMPFKTGRTYMCTSNFKDPRLPPLCPFIGNVHNSDGSVYTVHRKSVVFSQKK